MRPRRRGLRRLIGAVLLLGMLEVALRLAVEWSGRLPPVADESVQNEWSWAREHLLAGAARLFSELVADPLLGWRNAPGLRRDGRTTNATGMRGTREVAPVKPEGSRRLVIVGDSYSFGVGVRDEETFPARLQAVLPPEWEVLNLSVPGYGTDQQLLMVEDDGLSLSPDVVVLGFFTRDYSRNLLSFRSFAKPSFQIDGDGLRLAGSPTPSPESLYDDYVSGRRRIGKGMKSYLFEALMGLGERWHGDDVSEDAQGWQLLARMMVRFQSSMRRAGAAPMWLILPDRGVLGEGEADQEALMMLVEEKAAALGLPCLSLATAFRTAGTDPPVFDTREEGGHLSAEGHRLVASELHAALVEHGLVAISR